MSENKTFETNNQEEIEKVAADMHFMSNYDDFVMYTNELKEGAEIWIKDLNDEKFYKGKIVKAIYRNDDPDKYDETNQVDEGDMLDYEYSGEFIENNDCVYVFVKTVQEEMSENKTFETNNQEEIEKVAADMYFMSNYDDFVMYTNELKEGAEIWIKDLDDEKFYKGKIVKAIYRNDDPDKYDETDQVDEGDMLDYEYSGEFIEDNDCVYVFVKTVQEEIQANSRKKAVVTWTDGYSIRTTIYSSLDKAKIAMKDEYEAQLYVGKDKLVEDMTYISDDGMDAQVTIEAEDMLLWHICIVKFE